MNTETSRLVSSRGLPNLAQSRELPGGTAYRAFDRPAGTPIFVAAQYTMASASDSVHLRLVKSSLFGTAPTPYGTLELIVVPATIPDTVTPAVPQSVTATISRLTDNLDSTIEFDNELISEGSLQGNHHIRFRWALDQDTAAMFSSALSQGLQLFVLQIHCIYDAVDVDRLLAGSEPEPDVVQFEKTSIVQLAESAGAVVSATIEEVAVSPLPNGTWRIETDSVMPVPIIGIEKLGVQFSSPAYPPRRPSSAEAIAWLEPDVEPIATLRLSPLEAKKGHGSVIALVRTANGIHTQNGPSREIQGSLFMIRPNDLPVNTVQLRAEQALLDAGSLSVNVVGRDGKTLYGTEFDTSSVTLAVADTAQMQLMARITSNETGDVATSLMWPSRSGVVDRAWFSGFGPGAAQISVPGSSHDSTWDIHIRLADQPEDKARVVRIRAPEQSGEWRYMNTGPYQPQCLYRVSVNGDTPSEWTGPVAVSTRMQLGRANEHWQLTSADEIKDSPEPGIDPESENTNPIEESVMGERNTETINGIECHWDTNDPYQLYYRPPSIRPKVNVRGEPLVSLIVSGGNVSVQVSAEWALKADDLISLRKAYAESANINVALIRLGLVSVGNINAELISVDEAGKQTILATTPTSGFGTHAAALHAASTAAETHTALSAAFAGTPGRLLLRYHAAELDLSADVGLWLADSPISHITTIPGQ